MLNPHDKKYKVLIVAPYPIIPTVTGARIRVYEIALGLSESDIQVTVLMPMSPSQYTKIRFNDNLTFEVVPYPFVIPFLFTNKPFPYLYLVSLHPGYRFLIQKYLRNFNVIQFEGVSFGNLLNHIPSNKTIVYDAHNVEYDDIKSECRQQWISKQTYKRIFKLERQMVFRADQILTCSIEDAARFSQLYGIQDNKFTVIPNGIHLNKDTSYGKIDPYQFPTLLSFLQRAIFSGSDVAHNREAVRFLIEFVAPQLRKECAFVIKGQCGQRFRRQKAENVFFDTRPGSVAPYAKVCTVAVNPVTHGSGTSMKILDYLAHRLPVVSEEFGIRGYEDLKIFITLTEPDQFAEALRGRLQFQPGTIDVLKKYTWKVVAEKLSKFYLNKS